jgi:hypothetical protein
MSVLRITSAAIDLARRAARTASTTQDAELEGQLADLVVHLVVLKSQCAILSEEVRTLRGGMSEGVEEVAPEVVAYAGT